MGRNFSLKSGKLLLHSYLSIILFSEKRQGVFIKARVCIRINMVMLVAKS